MIELDTSTKSLRNFGITSSVLLPLVFCLLLPWLYQGQRPAWPLYTAGLVLIVTMAAPCLLRWPYVTMMTVSVLISRVVNTIVLALVFFLIVTPMGVIMRLFRRGDPLHLRSNAASTRVERRDSIDMKRPF